MKKFWKFVQKNVANNTITLCFPLCNECGLATWYEKDNEIRASEIL